MDLARHRSAVDCMRSDKGDWTQEAPGERKKFFNCQISLDCVSAVYTGALGCGPSDYLLVGVTVNLYWQYIRDAIN